MALRYLDSMGDHYTAADATLKWTSTFGFIVREPGLHGYGLRGGLTKGMLFGSTTIIMEAYIRHLSGGAMLFAIGDTDQGRQITCTRNSDGGVEVDRYGSNPALDRIFQSVPDLIRTDTWYHFGWTVFLHPSAGTVTVRLNGGTICDISGIKTTATSLPFTGAVGSFTVSNNAAATQFDDLVVMDNVDDGINDPRLPGGGGFDKFIGPVEIRVKRPNGVGLSAEWTPVPAPPNWENVNDPTSDVDTTYNRATVEQVGASDLFAMEDVAPGEDVVAVQSLVLARKTEEGIAAIAPLVSDGTTTTVGATVYQPNNYSYLHAPEPTASGGVLWNAARWNAMQYGYRRTV